MQGDRDIFRDTWVRYLGYANEVGESFRPLISPATVRASYGVAMAYVMADTAHKSLRGLWKTGSPIRVFTEAGDALIWQTLASVIIPGFTINRISHFAGSTLEKRAPKMPIKTRNWVVVAIGLASIPFIIRPIDTGVTILMNMTYRQIFGTGR